MLRKSWIKSIALTTLSTCVWLPWQLVEAKASPQLTVPQPISIASTARIGHASAKSVSSNTPTHIRVLLIGSSVAHGWKDVRAEGGYIHRAFSALSQITPAKYDVIDQAVPGQGVMTILDKYPTWLNQFQPNIVVIAWGGLDDLYDKTPVDTYAAQIRWQISLALEHHADVFVITPPISKASYTQYRVGQQLLMNQEMDVAQSFHSPNIYVYNVFDEMKQFLTIHHETYLPYMGDAWHPNADGHALAAQMLLQDMMRSFSNGLPTFQ